jgi:putative phosphoesterase
MTRIIALSDTHLEGKMQLPLGLAELMSGADMILHAGDFVSFEVYQALAEMGRLEAVCGNADSPELKRLLPVRKTIDIEGIRIGLVHRASHSFDTTGAEMMAREMEVGVLVFGHIHRPIVEKGDRLLICPGSPTFPRQSAPSVAELEIRDGRISGRIVPLGRPTCDYLRYAQSLAEKSSRDED